MVALEVLRLELEAYYETFAESALCLVVYLVSNCNNSRMKPEQ